MRIDTLIFFSLLLIFVSCTDEKRFFEENNDIKKAEWFKKDAPIFTFEIEDTSAAYHLFYNVRNTLDYPYYNLYLQYQLSDSSAVISNEQNELYLFDPSTGEPSGDGGFFGTGSFGDIYDHTYPFKINHKFPHPGTYKLSIQQYMRNEDPLNEIMSVGLRIEKAVNQ